MNVHGLAALFAGDDGSSANDIKSAWGGYSYAMVGHLQANKSSVQRQSSKQRSIRVSTSNILKYTHGRMGEADMQRSIKSGNPYY